MSQIHVKRYVSNSYPKICLKFCFKFKFEIELTIHLRERNLDSCSFQSQKHVLISKIRLKLNTPQPVQNALCKLTRPHGNALQGRAKPIWRRNEIFSYSVVLRTATARRITECHYVTATPGCSLPQSLDPSLLLPQSAVTFTSSSFPLVRALSSYASSPRAPWTKCAFTPSEEN
jgi:hypothetical protein